MLKKIISKVKETIDQRAADSAAESWDQIVDDIKQIQSLCISEIKESTLNDCDNKYFGIMLSESGIFSEEKILENMEAYQLERWQEIKTIVEEMILSHREEMAKQPAKNIMIYSVAITETLKNFQEHMVAKTQDLMLEYIKAQTLTEGTNDTDIPYVVGNIAEA